MFITFEGIDGAGKSTQIARLVTRLEEHGWAVVKTREPGGTKLGDALREMLLNPEQAQMSPRTEALLYATSRAQLLHEVIRPALAAGKIVVCDRYVDASLAYQGAGLGLGVEEVYRLNEFATEGLKPDLTFLFDLPVETSHNRLSQSRGTAPLDRIERRSSEYFSRVRNEFLNIARVDAARVIVIDATQHPDDLEKEIWMHTAKKLQ